MNSRTVPVLVVIFLNLIIISRMPAWAQTPTDPATIKFKSFTPPPTRTPTITPTSAASPTPVSPTDPGGNGGGDSCTPSNRGLQSDCDAMGLSLQMPKPRYLKDTSLCTQSTMYPFYNSSFVPPDLSNLNNALGNEFWVYNANIKYNTCLASDLKKMLKYIVSNYDCEPFVAYGYRSYAEQEGLWRGKNCDTNPNCGVAPPGKSLHQAGIAVDLFCAVLSGGDLIDFYNIPDDFTGLEADFNFNRPLRTYDPPHFNGL